MLTDGLKKFTEEQMVKDIAELVCSQMEHGTENVSQ